MSDGDDALLIASQQLAKGLRRTGLRIVFAESCTAGLVTAMLARTPGISEYVCGSAVVYRNATKTAWLGVSAEELADESIGPVSEQVAAAMARGVLERTPEADIAASVTGHLGPDAPPSLDGIAFIALASRDRAQQSVRVDRVERSVILTEAEIESPFESRSLRHLRQRQAAIRVLRLVADSLDSAASPG